MSRLKLYLITALRNFGLRRLADGVQFRVKAVKHAADNERFVQEHPSFTLPPKHLVFDANHSVNWENYYATGKSQAKILADIFLRHRPGSGATKILEWGVGPGRIIRHLRENTGIVPVQLFGCDYNAESIKWCQQNLPDIAFSQNNLSPPTLFGGAEFDFVYAISVFTHLSERSQTAWLAEIRRILSPKGLFIFTTQGEFYRQLLTTPERHVFDGHQMVVRSSDQEGKKLFSSFASPQCITRMLRESSIDILQHIPGPDNGFAQDLWVVRT